MRNRPRNGFVLAEVIIVLVISAIVATAVLAALVALVRGLQPPAVKLQGEVLPIAPTFGSFPSAVRLHRTFTDRVAQARAVYVFGGRHLSIPTDAPPSGLKPLRAQALPAISDFSPGLPLDAKSFQELYSQALGDEQTDGSPEDFTVITIGCVQGSLAVTSFVQVRRTDTSVSDGTVTLPYIVREVKLWDIGAGEQRYAFAERPAQSPAIFVGAVHTWLRYLTGVVAEEGPVCAVFPDPWVYAGARGRSDDIPTFSRFSYLLLVSR